MTKRPFRLPGESRADIAVAAAALALMGAAAVVGGLLYLAGRPVFASAPPFFAHWLPHLGPGSPLALVIAGLVIWQGQQVAARLSWRSLLFVGYGTTVAWTLSLALVDGWQRGFAGRLTTGPEYLSEVPGVTDLPAMVRGFAARILDLQPDSWTTHVSGHPPGALLVFVGMDRVGLGGGGWAALLCVLVGGVASVAVPETVRLLSADATAGSEVAARAAVPFAVLFPGAVWVGASADGLFAGVAAVGVMLVARGLVRGAPIAACVGGVVLGFALYLSYGLTLLAPIVLAVVVLARRWRPLVFTVLGVGAVVAGFAAAGFWWWDGYQLVVERYYQGVASERAYGYWIWANLAAATGAAGFAALPILRRAVLGVEDEHAELSEDGRSNRSTELSGAHPALPSDTHPAGPAVPLDAQPRRIEAAVLLQPPAESSPRRQAQTTSERPTMPARAGRGRLALSRTRWRAIQRGGRSLLFKDGFTAARLLPLAAAVAILAADLSGLSKAEVERIWLPFTVWFAAGAVLLPSLSRRSWLVVQAATALLINHLLLTSW